MEQWNDSHFSPYDSDALKDRSIYPWQNKIFIPILSRALLYYRLPITLMDLAINHYEISSISHPFSPPL